MSSPVHPGTIVWLTAAAAALRHPDNFTPGLREHMAQFLDGLAATGGGMGKPSPTEDGSK